MLISNNIALQYLIFVGLQMFTEGTTYYSNVENILITELVQNGTPTGRPVKSNNQPVHVSFDLQIHKIEKLLTKEQHLILHSFVAMRWQDPRFVWDPSKHNGTRLVNLPRSAAWTPDIILYNSADIGYNAPSDFYKSPIHVYYNGTMVWFSTVAWQSSCAVDITWFPVDRQTCELIFGSLAYSKMRLKLSFHRKPSKRSHYLSKHHVSNGEWNVLGFSARLHDEYYDVNDGPVSQIIYTIKLKRRPTYFFLYLIFPVLAIVFLSLLIFKIPPDTGERIGFAVTILLTMGVYLMVISQDLPRKADSAPLVGILYVTLFYVMVLGTVTGVVTAGLSFKITTPPQWLRKMILKVTKKNSKKVGAIRNSFRVRGIQEEACNEDEAKSNVELELADHNERDNNGRSLSREVPNSQQRPALRSKTSLAFNIHRSLQEFTQKEVDNQEQWHEISYFLDRIFFWIYFVAIIAASCSVLLGLELKSAS